MEEHADGIYIGLSFEPYLADPALGSSVWKVLKDSAPEWWWGSHFNTLVDRKSRSDEERRFQLMGQATHVALCEGIGAYQEAFGVLPSKQSHPDALDTAEELRRACDERGLPKAGDKSQLIQRLLQWDPDLEILDRLQAEWRLAGKRALTQAEDARIRLLHAVAMRSPEEIEMAGGEKVSLREAFEGGLTELSVFWTDDDGVRHRARFDKLKRRATVDLKTIGRPITNFKGALLQEIVNRGYLYQAVRYDEARRQIPRLLKAGLVFGGSADDHKYLELCAGEENWAWVNVFVKMTGAPQMRAIPVDREGPQYRRAAQDIEEGYANFLSYRATFGLEPGRMWFDPDVIWTPETEDWPLYAS